VQLAEAAFKEQIAQVVCLRLLEGESGTACMRIALFRVGVLRFVSSDSHSSYRMHVFLLQRVVRVILFALFCITCCRCIEKTSVSL